MKRALVILLALALLAGLGFWLLTSPALQRAGLEPVPEGAPDLANGRAMFFAGDCTSCHLSPNQDDRNRLGGGKPLPSPFGTFYPPNVSPHADGIGSWTTAQFQRAMRGGVSPDGRHYYPAFPYTSYQRMRPEDLRDLFAYLKTLPAVPGRVRDHDLPFPFSVRRGARAVEARLPRRQGFRARSGKARELEPRRLSRRGRRALRRMPQRPQRDRRHPGRAPLCRRPQSRGQGLGPEHHAGQNRHRRLVEGRHRRRAVVRPDARAATWRLEHGRGCPQYFAARARRPRCNRRVRQDRCRQRVGWKAAK